MSIYTWSKFGYYREPRGRLDPHKLSAGSSHKMRVYIRCRSINESLHRVHRVLGMFL